MAVTPTGREIKIDQLQMIVSRTDRKGIIEYANQDFCTVSGYSLPELINKPHNIVRHPDMPAAIFKLMWKRLENGQDIYAVVKNLAKNGDHYWVTTKFDIRKHPISKNVTGYVAYRQAAPVAVVEAMSKLYANMLDVEKINGINASENFLNTFLDSRHTTYDEFVHTLAVKDSGLKSFFKKMTSLFS